MPTTTVYGNPYPVLTDTPDVPRDVKALADRLELMLNTTFNVAANRAIGTLGNMGTFSTSKPILEYSGYSIATPPDANSYLTIVPPTATCIMSVHATMLSQNTAESDVRIWFRVDQSTLSLLTFQIRTVGAGTPAGAIRAGFSFLIKYQN